MHTVSGVAATAGSCATCASVGVVLPDRTPALFSDPLLPRLLRGIEEVLSADEIQMVMLAADPRGGFSRLERYLAAGHVGAVIVIAPPQSNGLTAMLDGIGLPVVYGGRPQNRTNATFVDVDDQLAGRRATEHLIEQGRRHIAHIAGPHGISPASERLQGFREAMWNAALRSDLVEHGSLDRDSGEMAMSRLLNRFDDIDAVFAASDAMAAGAMWAMQILGRQVPDDVAIIGFDDSPLAATTQPPLSSVRRPIEDIGRQLARLIIEVSEAGIQAGRRPPVLDPALSVRESTRRPG